MMRSQPNISLPEHSKKRPRDSPPQLWKKRNQGFRGNSESKGQHVLPSDLDERHTERKEQEGFVREQTRLNQIQEAEQMREWVAKEDDFVLKQSKKKAQIRVREGRASLIDWLAVTLSVVDKTVDPLEDEVSDEDIDIVDPAGVFEGLAQHQVQDLGKDIGTYLTLESNASNREYWNVQRPNPYVCKFC